MKVLPADVSKVIEKSSMDKVIGTIRFNSCSKIRRWLQNEANVR